LFANCGRSIKILTSNEGKSISDLANQVAQQNYDVVVAAGGDGTINAVASALVGHTSTRLGILPLERDHPSEIRIVIPKSLFI
jgi:diacylglycerol kinase family enzyme